MQRTTMLSASNAALAILAILQIVMLGALYSGTDPHPPLRVSPFALGPFLGASVAIAVAALASGALATRVGAGFSILAALLALVSYGPQKWIDPAIAQIWPAVLLGQVAALGLIVLAVMRLRKGEAAP